MLNNFVLDMLDEMACGTIDTVMFGKQSPADNVHTINTFVEMCKLVQRRYGVEEVPDELGAKLDAINALLDININALNK